MVTRWFGNTVLRELWVPVRTQSGVMLMALGILAMAVPAQAERLALVIGNAAYAQATLKNPLNDARAMAARLQALGFRTTEVENLKRAQIGRTVNAFVATIRAGDEVVFFYAGHGVQVNGVNYFPAVDAEITTPEDVALNSMNLSDLIGRLDAAKAAVKLLFLDACRNDPFIRSFRGGDHGLARMVDAPSGTLIQYATRPGRVAADGEGNNGLYTANLLKALQNGKEPVEQTLKRVATAVKVASKGDQDPWIEGHIDGDFCFGGCGDSSAERQEDAQLAGGRAHVQSAEEVEQDTWNAVKGSQDGADLQTYLDSYPNGKFAALAKLRQRKLLATASASGRSGVRPAALARADAAGSAGGIPGPGQTFRDCPDCPELVVIPGGTSTIGSPEGEAGRYPDEGPQHSVSVRRFAFGTTLVTRGQFAQFVRETGYPAGDSCWSFEEGRYESRSSRGWQNPGFRQDDNHPVVCVNWDDAKAYAAWLARKTGHEYRLPSEAEWEYAARAGTATSRYWGDDSGQACRYANGADLRARRLIPGAGDWTIHGCDDGYAYTAPVGSFLANGFGLKDILGNAWEWTEDCWHETYDGAPADGSAWTGSGECAKRVLRGGAWDYGPQLLRSAYRSRVGTGNRDVSLGFRLARTLP